MGAPLLTRAFRALTEHAGCPDGCGLEPVKTNRFAPHLLAGERAVIDPDDREPVQGEIYVVRIASTREPGGYRLAIVQLRGRLYDFAVEGAGGWRPETDTGWMMHFQAIQPRPVPKFYATPEDAARNVSTWTMCDGPLRTDGMRRRIVGRVVGFMPAGGRA